MPSEPSPLLRPVRMRIRRTGNSLAITIPDPLVELLGFNEGDIIPVQFFPKDRSVGGVAVTSGEGRPRQGDTMTDRGRAVAIRIPPSARTYGFLPVPDSLARILPPPPQRFTMEVDGRKLSYYVAARKVSGFYPFYRAHPEVKRVIVRVLEPRTHYSVDWNRPVPSVGSDAACSPT